jgi:hypothetical protein
VLLFALLLVAYPELLVGRSKMVSINACPIKVKFNRYAQKLKMEEPEEHNNRSKARVKNYARSRNLRAKVTKILNKIV